MKRWWLVMALMLSLGVNLGILVTRLLPAREAADPAVGSPDAGSPDAGSPDAGSPDAGSPDAGSPDAGSPDEAPFERRQLSRLVNRMADELGLEDERRDAFVAIQRRFFRQTLDTRARVRRGQARLRRELTSEQPDRAAIDATLAQLAAARADLEKAFVDNLLDSREILDPQQRRRFLRFIGRLRQARDDLERRFPPQRRAPQRIPPSPPP